MEKAELSTRLSTNLERIREAFGGSTDLVVRELAPSAAVKIAVACLDGMVDKKLLHESVMKSLLDRIPDDRRASLDDLRGKVLDVSDIRPLKGFADVLEAILSGCVVVLLDGEAAALKIGLQGWETRSITESKTQSVVRGPQEAFTETMRTNTAMIRRRVKDTRVRLTTISAGRRSKTDVAVMYMEGVADDALVRRLIERIESIELERVLEGQYLEEVFYEGKRMSLFPRIYQTDRPDTIAAGIMDGRIAVIVDGTPFVLLVPALFIDFLQSAEDYYQPVVYANVIRLLRYLALAICLLAPAVYIALTTYHQDMIPTQLVLSLAAQREGIPFPAFVEALLMESTFEILREAGIRMPRTIGQAVSIVGTIVIGQAAVEASIVSAAMVIIVSITAISSFVIPSYAMSIPIRLFRFGFMLLAAVYGVYGITIGLLLAIVHLVTIDSFGMPYMSPNAPFDRGRQRDAGLRLTYRKFGKFSAKGGKR